LLATTFAAMLLTAKIFSKSEAKTERKDNGVPETHEPVLASTLPSEAGSHPAIAL
jgi:hypothetical protein